MATPPSSSLRCRGRASFIVSVMHKGSFKTPSIGLTGSEATPFHCDWRTEPTPISFVSDEHRGHSTCTQFVRNKIQKPYKKCVCAEDWKVSHQDNVQNNSVTHFSSHLSRLQGHFEGWWVRSPSFPNIAYISACFWRHVSRALFGPLFWTTRNNQYAAPSLEYLSRCETDAVFARLNAESVGTICHPSQIWGNRVKKKKWF